MSESNRPINLTLPAIQRILYEIWDPIEVSQLAPRDEYNSYAPAVHDYLWSGGSRDGLIAMLDGFTRQEMGIKPIPGRSALAADALLALRDQ